MAGMVVKYDDDEHVDREGIFDDREGNFKEDNGIQGIEISSDTESLLLVGIENGLRNSSCFTSMFESVVDIEYRIDELKEPNGYSSEVSLLVHGVIDGGLGEGLGLFSGRLYSMGSDSVLSVLAALAVGVSI